MNNHHIEREKKLNAIIDRLATGNYRVRLAPRECQDQRHAISRWQLRLLIMEAIGVGERHCVSRWINELLINHVIEPNPHTSSWDSSPSIHMPHDSTYYFINEEKLVRRTLPSSNSE